MRFILITLFFCSSFFAHSQGLVTESLMYANDSTQTKEKSIRPLRIGLRVGVPHLATGNIEYVTPLFDNRVAITADYLSVSKSYTDGLFKFDNLEVGTNIYFNNKGRGFYGSLTYFSFRSGVGFKDYEFTDNFTSDGRADFDFNTFNVKLGFKVGRTFYFRVEAGYGFGKIPDHIIVHSTTYGLTVPVYYAPEDVPDDIPGLSTSGILVFNIGIGFGLF